MLAQTGTTGLSGLIMDKMSCSIVKSFPASAFQPVPGYKQSPQPHYVGRLFGMWDIIEHPGYPTDTVVCWGKGQGIGEAPYLIGTAIPAMAFKHSVMTDLNYKQTLYQLAFRDIQPFDGREYLIKLTFTD